MQNLVVGATVEDRFSSTIRQKIQNLIGSKSEWFSARRAEYISSKSNWLSMLEENDFLVSKRGNGLRTLLFLFTTPQGPAAFLFTSKNSLWYNPMVFPQPNNPNVFHTECLIDGELNFFPNVERPTSVVFTAFDLIAIGGVSVTRRSLSTRLGILKSDIITPRHIAVKNNPSIPQPFQYCNDLSRIEMCHYERSYGLHAAIAQARSAQAKGLIFTPVKTPYTPFRRMDNTPYMFQWRLPEENTFPFKIQILWDKERKAHYQIFIGERQTHKYFDDFTPDQELLRTWRQSPPDGKIVDCVYDPEWITHIWENGYAATSRKGGWKFVRFRPDRTFADEEKSLNERFESLISPIQIEHIEEAADRIRSKWKEREALPADRRLSNPTSDRRPSEMPPSNLNPLDLKRKSTPNLSTSPSPKRTKTDSIPGNIITAEPDEEDEYSEEEEEISSGYVPRPQALHTTHKSLDTSQPSSPIPKISSPQTPSKLHTLAHKTNLQKLKNEVYIPLPPPSTTILFKKTEMVEDYDGESPIEDFAMERYAHEPKGDDQDEDDEEMNEADDPKLSKRNSFWDVI